MARRKKGKRSSGEPFTYIQEGTVIRGDVEAAGRMRVHGSIRGNVTVTGLLEVAAEGSIEGDRIEAHEVRILGSVEATVAATGKVEIWSGGRLEGDVRAASIDIEEGALFTGRSEMRPPGARAALPQGIPDENPATPPAPARDDVERDEGDTAAPVATGEPGFRPD